MALPDLPSPRLIAFDESIEIRGYGSPASKDPGTSQPKQNLPESGVIAPIGRGAEGSE
jgi:hypothetical protein